MRDYGKISTSIWNSQKFRALPDGDSRLLYFYLHTCPHVNSVGCFVLRDGYAAEDLGWDVERYRRGIETLSKALLIQFEPNEKLVRITNFLRFDPFSNINHAKGAVKLALGLPDCGVKLLLLHEIQKIIDEKFTGKLPEIAKGIETLSNGYRTPEPEPEPYSVSKDTGASAPQLPLDANERQEKVDPDKVMFDTGIAVLGDGGVPEAKARSMIGKWRKQHGDEAVMSAIGRCRREAPSSPIEFIQGCFRFQKSKSGPEPGDTRTNSRGEEQVYTNHVDGWMTVRE